MEESVRYACRELRAGDIDAIERLLADGPRYQTLLHGPLLRATRAGDPDVWWYGALAEGTDLRALMGIRGHSALLYGESDAAVTALAKEGLKAQQQAMPSGTHRHQLFGEAGTMGLFWPIFRAIGRQVVLDRPRPLFGSKPGLESPSARATLRVATAADTKLVSELSAEQSLEAQGYDPRRANRAGHEARVARVIAEGRQLVAEAGGKPALIAEVTPIDDGTVLLERVYVPRPSRALKRLVAGALVAAAGAAPVGDREALFFAEIEGLAEAAENVGFVLRATWHTVVMYG